MVVRWLRLHPIVPGMTVIHRYHGASR